MSQTLTNREKQILILIASGLSNKEISQKLFISLSTVENHIHNIYLKLDVSKRAHAIIYAVREGIVSQTNNFGKT